MPRFSLIVATVNRTNQLSVLLESLANQEMRDFELIIVDQNPDDRLCQLLMEWASRNADDSNGKRGSIPLKHLRCVPGVSRARNLGLMHSSGDILAFPDDDCWYLPDTLQNVDQWFKHHTGYGILSVGCRDEQGRVSGNRWWEQECDLKWINIFKTSGTCCFFVCRPPEDIPLKFDESLGPGAGTRYGSAEDTDFLVTLMGYGIRGRFNSLLHVGHPSRDGFIDAKRAESYGAGFGRVLGKHSKPFLFVGFVVFDCVRAALRASIADRGRASQLWSHARGMIKAYFSR